jgi:hypothetical protein
MDTLNSLSLGKVNISLLHHLTCFLSGNELGKLWFCGDSSLNLRLRQPGVVRTFDFSTNNFVKRAWPNIMSVFPTLEMVTISVPESAQIVGLLGVDLTTIPKTTKQISFRFGNGYMCLLESDPNEMECHMVDIKNLWPNLERLEWSDTVLSTGVPLVSASIFLRALPQSLTCLKLGKIVILEVDDIRFLPSSLTELGAEMKEVNEDPRSEVQPIPSDIAFPPGLTHLRLFSYQATHLLKHLPSSLTYLRMPVYPSEWHLLPRNLINFGCIFWESIISPEYVASLPQTLLELWIPASRLTLDGLAQLPQGLRLLSCIEDIDCYPGGVSPHFTDILAVIPPKLFISSIFARIMASSSQWHLIPPYTEAVDALTLDLLHFQHLPTNLKAFCIPLLVPTPLLIEMFSKLPNVKLERLDINTRHIPLDSLSAITERQRHNPHFQNLTCPAPRDAIHLFILPSSLTQLTITTEMALEHVTWDWAVNLTSLSAKVTTNRSLDALISPLPQSLRKLTLISGRMIVPPNFAPELPPNLTNLSLYNLTDLCDNFLKKMPRKLQTLNLMAQSSSITSYGLCSLPYSMLFLYLTPTPSPDIIESISEARPYFHCKWGGNNINELLITTPKVYLEELATIRKNHCIPSRFKRSDEH